MRFLIDENVPFVVVITLRELGHDRFAVAESTPSALDPDIMAQARHEDRVRVTFDQDYSRMIFREGQPAPSGVVYMQSRPQHAALVGDLFLTLFRTGAIDPISRFVVIEPGTVRSMPLV
ncbi:DUF5615 family PIN-like protein [uncultured Sphingomonas sp.]|uniref:DUF5615 family PIN-like protein n=1 Tax=uncultured Sphingomonas sp. TaxID=158754 RepID=UPI0035CAFA2B